MTANPADAVMRTVAVIAPDGQELKMGMVASSQQALAKNILAQFPGYRLKNPSDLTDNSGAKPNQLN